MLTNKKSNQKRLTIEELKKHEGFENYSEKEAEETINDLEVLSVLLFDLHSSQNSIKQNLNNNCESH
jgi:hypothetical protein